MVTPAASAAPPIGADQALIERLRAGDEAAFADLVRRWSPAMLRLARNFVSTNQSAEDAVQDAWLGMVDGLERFEGRASLRSWTFTILVNRAKTRGVREHRTVVNRAPGGGARDVVAGRTGAGRSTGAAACRCHHARRAGVRRRRGVFGAGRVAGEPAGAAAPGQSLPAGGLGNLLPGLVGPDEGGGPSPAQSADQDHERAAPPGPGCPRRACDRSRGGAS